VRTILVSATPGFDQLMKAVARLGRSLTDLLTFLTELHAKGIDLFLHQQGLDTSTPSGRAMFQMLGRKGITLSRPRTSKRTEAAKRKVLQTGTGIRKTAAMVGVGTGTVQRIKLQMTAEASR
jgi:hypothetical protein